MASRSSILFACLLVATAASAAGADKVYKYRGADGGTTYSNRPIANAELIEVIDYKFASPAARSAPAAKSDVAREKRVLEHLAALDRAWTELQDAQRALALAEARLAAGVAPLEGEATALAGPATPVPPAVGGPQAAAPPAVGGPMGTRRGGGRNADYVNRMAALEADVATARARVDAAQKNYNQIR